MNLTSPKPVLIKDWNLAYDAISKQLGAAAICMGALEDLLLTHTTCPDCSSELIRVDSVRNSSLVGGIIYCSRNLVDETHPSRHWIEVWPHDPFLSDELTDEETKGLHPNEYAQLAKKRREQVALKNNELLFIGSNPRIRNCYRTFSIWNHLRLRDNYVEDNIALPDFLKSPLPEPAYVHLIQKS